MKEIPNEEVEQPDRPISEETLAVVELQLFGELRCPALTRLAEMLLDNFLQKEAADDAAR
jgi:hypothetical protein